MKKSILIILITCSIILIAAFSYWFITNNSVQTKDNASSTSNTKNTDLPLPELLTKAASIEISDNISPWTKPINNPVIYPTEKWEDKAVFEPTVIFEDNIFKMWYTGGNKCAVGYATSSDGINWTKHQNNPILGLGEGGEPGMACRNNVIKHENTFYLYYINETGNLFVATSQDGINFSKHNTPVLTKTEGTWEKHLANSFQWKEDNTWYMIYEASSSDGYALWSMGLAYGSDPFTWTKAPNNPLKSLQIGQGMYGGPWLKKIDSTYYLWHHASTPLDNIPTDIYLQASSNLQDWKLVVPNPVVSRTQPEWELDQVADPYIVEANGKTYMYYDGDDNTVQTGYRAWIGYVIYNGSLKQMFK